MSGNDDERSDIMPYMDLPATVMDIGTADLGADLRATHTVVEHHGAPHDRIRLRGGSRGLLELAVRLAARHGRRARVGAMVYGGGV
jgi:hypothetical protein